MSQNLKMRSMEYVENNNRQLASQNTNKKREEKPVAVSKFGSPKETVEPEDKLRKIYTKTVTNAEESQIKATLLWQDLLRKLTEAQIKVQRHSRLQEEPHKVVRGFKSKMEELMNSYIPEREIVPEETDFVFAFKNKKIAFNNDNQVQIYSIKDMTLEKELGANYRHRKEIIALEFDEEALVLFSGCLNGSVILWKYDESKGRYHYNQEFSENLSFKSFYWNQEYKQLFLKSKRDQIFACFAQISKEGFKNRFELRRFKKKQLPSKSECVFAQNELIFANRTTFGKEICFFDFSIETNLLSNFFTLKGYIGPAVYCKSIKIIFILKDDFTLNHFSVDLTNKKKPLKKIGSVGITDQKIISFSVSRDGRMLIILCAEGKDTYIVRFFTSDTDKKYYSDVQKTITSSSSFKRVHVTDDKDFFIISSEKKILVMAVPQKNDIDISKFISQSSFRDLVTNRNQQRLKDMVISKSGKTIIAVVESKMAYNLSIILYVWTHYEQISDLSKEAKIFNFRVKRNSIMNPLTLSISDDDQEVMLVFNQTFILLRKKKRAMVFEKIEVLQNIFKFNIMKGDETMENPIDNTHIMEINQGKFFDGSKEIITSDQKNLAIWVKNKDTPAKYQIKTMIEDKDHNEYFETFFFTKDKKMIITIGKKTIKVWRKQFLGGYVTTQRLNNKAEMRRRPNCFITDNHKLIVLADDKYIKVFIQRFNKDEYSFVQIFNNQNILKIYPSLDQKYFMALGQEKQKIVKIWSLNEGSVTLLQKLGSFEGILTVASDLKTLFMIESTKKSIKTKVIKISRPFEVEDSLRNFKNLIRIFEMRNKGTVFNSNHLLKLKDKVSKSRLNIGGRKAQFTEDIEVHSKYNLTLLAILSKKPRVLREIIHTFKYKPFFYPNLFNPIDTAVKMNHIDTLNVIKTYFSKNLDLFSSYLTFDRFVECMKTSNEEFKEFVIEHFMLEATAMNKDTDYGDFPLGDKEYIVMDCCSEFMEHSLRKSIKEKSYKLRENGASLVKVRYLTTGFPINYSIIYRSSRKILLALDGLSDDMIVGNVKYLIRHFWTENWKVAFFFLCLIWFNFACFSFYTIWYSSRNWIGSIGLISSLLLLASESLNMKEWARWKWHFYNWIDLYQYISIPTIIIINLAGKLDLTNVYFNLWINFTLFLSGYRAIGELRIFNQVRYMLDMINQVFYDMIGFTVILFFSIFLFSVIGVSAHKVTDDYAQSFENLNLMKSINYYYNVAYGDWDDANNMELPEIINYLTSSIFLALVMLNLLIAVISQTFDDFQEKKELVDLRLINTVLLDYAYAFSYLNKFSWIRKREHEKMKFICVIVKENNEVEIQKSLNEMKEKFSEKFKKLEAGNLELQKTNDDLKSKLTMMERQIGELKSTNSEIKHNGDRVTGMISSVLTKLDEINIEKGQSIAFSEEIE